MSLKTFYRALLIVAAMVGFAGTAHAQPAPTPEGDSIVNIATVSYNDGGTGSYNTADTVVVRIGFKAALNVAASETQRPASPSTENSYSFQISNGGNGKDTVSVAFAVGTGLTITSWFIRSAEYTSQAAFDAALASLELERSGAIGDTVTLAIEYSVDASRGGTSATIVPTATSVRSTNPAYGPGTQTGSVTLTVEPSAVAVTPDGGTQDYAPGSRTLAFTIQNDASVAITYVLSTGTTASSILSGSTINDTDVSTDVDGDIVITIAAGGSATIDVDFSVSNSGSFAPGDQGTLTLTATSKGAGATISNSGTWVVSLLRPRIVVTKVAQFADGTLIDADTTAKPGDEIRYVITVSNTGNVTAEDVEVADALSSLLTFDFAMINDATTPSVLRDAASPAWDFTSSTATNVVGKLATLTTADGTRTFTIKVTVK